MFVLFSTACSGQRPTLDNAASREVSQTSTTVAVDPSEPAVAPLEQRVLRIGVASAWSGDPADAGPASLANRVLADFLHEGLTAVGADGATVPALAQRWSVSDDRLTWTFVLDPEARDGAGDRIVARDVKRSFERVAARGSAIHAASALDAISGWLDYSDGATGGVAGLIAADDMTLVVQLDRPFEMLADLLAAPAYGIVAEGPDGAARTTGAFRYTDDPDRLEAVDSTSGVVAVELVRDGNATTLLREGQVDWVVLDDAARDDLPGDVLRQPLDLRVGVVARLGAESERSAVLASIASDRLVQDVSWLNPVANPLLNAQSTAALPDNMVVDVAAGPLEPLGLAVAELLSAQGATVQVQVSEVDEFAARVASGEATVFPVVLAGDQVGSGGALRFATPTGADDVFGDSGGDRGEIVAAIEAENDADRRSVLLAALEDRLRSEGLLVVVGQFEVRVAVGPDVPELRVRSDGTLDLSGFDQPEL